MDVIFLLSLLVALAIAAQRWGYDGASHSPCRCGFGVAPSSEGHPSS